MGTIWSNSEHPLFKVAATFLRTEDFDDGGPCDMLTFEGKKAVCLIHKYLGYKAKPEVCREYPEERETCRVEE